MTTFPLVLPDSLAASIVQPVTYGKSDNGWLTGWIVAPNREVTGDEAAWLTAHGLVPHLAHGLGGLGVSYIKTWVLPAE